MHFAVNSSLNNSLHWKWPILNIYLASINGKYWYKNVTKSQNKWRVVDIEIYNKKLVDLPWYSTWRVKMNFSFQIKRDSRIENIWSKMSRNNSFATLQSTILSLVCTCILNFKVHIYNANSTYSQTLISDVLRSPHRPQMWGNWCN